MGEKHIHNLTEGDTVVRVSFSESAWIKACHSELVSSMKTLELSQCCMRYGRAVSRNATYSFNQKV